MITWEKIVGGENGRAGRGVVPIPIKSYHGKE